MRISRRFLDTNDAPTETDNRSQDGHFWVETKLGARGGPALGPADHLVKYHLVKYFTGLWIVEKNDWEFNQRVKFMVAQSWNIANPWHKSMTYA